MDTKRHCSLGDCVFFALGFKESFDRPKAEVLTSRLINQKYFNLIQKYMWKFLEICLSESKSLSLGCRIPGGEPCQLMVSRKMAQ